jgi:hypothetical protein
MEDWIRLLSLDQWISFFFEEEEAEHIRNGRMDFESNRSYFGRMDLDLE